MDDTPNWRRLTEWPRKAADSLQNLRGTGIRGLAGNILSLTVLQVTSYLLPLITLPYLVRVLGADKFGLVAFAQALMQYFIILTDYGFNLSATRDIASNRSDMAKVSQIFSTVMMVRLALMTAGFGILYVLVLTIGRFAADPLIFLVSYGLVVGNVLFPVWFFQGMEKMKYSTIMTLVARTIFVVLIFVVVRTESDYILVPLLNSLGMVVAGIISLWMAVKKFHVRLHWSGWVFIAHQLKSSSQFFLSRISVSVYTSFNTLILGFLTTNQVVGYYAAAEKLFIAMRAAFYPLVQSLYPYMSSRENVGLFKKIFYLSVALAVAVGATVFFLSGTITHLVFGPAFEPSADIVRLFSLLIPIVVASILLGYPFLAALGREKYANFSVAIGSVGHLILIASIIPVISMRLVVLVTLVTETVVLAIRVYGVKKHRLWEVT